MQVAEVERIVAAFTDATNRHDIDEMLALVSNDVVFEGTTPPDGVRIEGDKASLRALMGRHISRVPERRRRNRGTDRLRRPMYCATSIRVRRRTPE